MAFDLGGELRIDPELTLALIVDLYGNSVQQRAETERNRDAIREALAAKDAEIARLHAALAKQFDEEDDQHGDGDGNGE